MIPLVLAALCWAEGRAEAAPDLSPTGDGEPLLVIVETGAGAGCDAVQVRQAVQQELGRAVLSPVTAPPRGSAALLVSVDGGRIAATFRGRGDSQVSRTIAAPRDVPARLRLIAWLAGNLVRDQLSSLLSDDDELTLGSPSPGSLASAPPPKVASAPATAHSVAPTSTIAPSDSGDALAAARPVAPPAPVEPAPLDTPWPSAAASTIVAATSPPDNRLSAVPLPDPSKGDPLWTVMVGGGPSVMMPQNGLGSSLSNGLSAAWQAEVEHHQEGGRVYGLALDVGPEPRQMGGIAVLAGQARRSGKWALGATAGAGLEAQRAMLGVSTTNTVTSHGVIPQTTSSRETTLAFYGRAAASLGRSLTKSLDLVARIGAHYSPGYNSPLAGAYVTTSLALRLTLP